MKLSTFIRLNPISFIVPSLRLGSHKFAKLLNDKLLDSIVVDSVPDENENEILIIVPKNQEIFTELLPNKFLNRAYKTYPKSIIVVIGFDMMVKIYNIFEHMKSISKYNIPLLYSPLLESSVEFDFKLVNRHSYEDSLLFNKGENNIHITTPMDFSEVISKILDNNNEPMYNIFCYYWNISREKSTYENLITYFNKVVDFYAKITTNDGKQLKFIDGEFIVI